MHRTRNRFNLGSSFRDLSLGSWKQNRLKPLKIGLVWPRNFSTKCLTTIEASQSHVSPKELQSYACQRQKRFFRTNFIMFDVKNGKKPSAERHGSPKFNSDYGARKQFKGPANKCTPRPSSNCRKRPKNPCCLKQVQLPPPCPSPRPEPPLEPPPPKICYRKCPPLPKLPRLPKCMKIPAPPPPPPLPKMPKLPKCPEPCSPPPPPPLPKCPLIPKCPECPPQKVCPPPPPCEPCPCPPPCPPPCCPPPPPCPPCPAPLPCPKPLPCPPPPPPILCPPCPPCAECPKQKPCPPPPPCCPCPCPEPPPPCPCPEPCPPCPPQISLASCPKDVPSCPKCDKVKQSGKGFLRRKMSTFHHPGSPWHLAKRKLHFSSSLMGKSSDSKKSSTCKAMTDICADKAKKGCAKPCPKKSDCEEKKPVCGEVKKEVQEKKKKQVLCPESCIPRGKCDLAEVKKPPKMVYGPVKCPTQKYVSPKPCPHSKKLKLAHMEHAMADSVDEFEKPVCIPPPLPKAPTKPVILCPCPPPPKLHPGPCPCYAFNKELTQPITMPPCPKKDKYPCCKESFLCPQEAQVCKLEKSCDVQKKKKEKRKKKKK